MEARNKNYFTVFKDGRHEVQPNVTWRETSIYLKKHFPQDGNLLSSIYFELLRKREQLNWTRPSNFSLLPVLEMKPFS